MSSDAAKVYVEACNREHAECALELVHAFDNNEREVSLSCRAVPLNDVDISCIAEALRNTAHPLRVLNMESNTFGLPGLQALLEAFEENPGVIRELRLGRNKLKDQAAVIIGHMLARDGCGIKVLDLSENGITKLGVIPIAAALANDSCDLVELSFHNNKIEAEAATFLGQAIRLAGKLRHLHLGYNNIRDTGAAQLAECIPLTRGLSTLDLTANRIGPSGGKELARALMTSTCNIQRLNLRHNLFDSETIELYGAVIASNTSLIQLFLGFMNPAPESAASVLAALRRNRTLLLLDIYGWKLPQDETGELLEDILQNNNSLAAIVTDACEAHARRVDAANDARDAGGLHSIYVGPDDHDAYTATKSLRRFSRAQSRRQSRGSSQRASRRSSRAGSPQDATGRGGRSSEAAFRSDSSRNDSQYNQEYSPTHHHNQQQQQQPQQFSREQPLPQQRTKRPSSPLPTNVATTAMPTPLNKTDASPLNSSERRSVKGNTDAFIQSNPNSNISSNLNSNFNSNMNSHTNIHVSPQDELQRLRRLVEEQREALRSLDHRVRSLEQRPACYCRTSNAAQNDSNPPSPDHQKVFKPHAAHHEQTNAVKHPQPQPQKHSQPQAHSHSQRRMHDDYGEASGDFTPPARAATPPPTRSGGRNSPERGVYSQRPTSTSDANNGANARNGNGRSSSQRSNGGGAERRSASVASTTRSTSEHCAAELYIPSGYRSDVSEPPAEPLEIPREKRPPEVALQTSSKAQENYQPNISPAPLRDTNPPRRKGSVMRQH